MKTLLNMFKEIKENLKDTKEDAIYEVCVWKNKPTQKLRKLKITFT